MNELLAYRVRMRFASRITFRRWFPVWVGFLRRTARPTTTTPNPQGQVIGIYLRVLSRAWCVQRKPAA
jgi:hypothetical protein